MFFQEGCALPAPPSGRGSGKPAFPLCSYPAERPTGKQKGMGGLSPSHPFSFILVLLLAPFLDDIEELKQHVLHALAVGGDAGQHLDMRRLAQREA